MADDFGLKIGLEGEKRIQEGTVRNQSVLQGSRLGNEGRAVAV